MQTITLITQTYTSATRALDALACCIPATDDLLEIADWLVINDHRHLRAIERIELAERLITRRRFLVGAGTVVLAGCSAPQQAATPPATMRQVESPLGPVDLPTQPQRVVALYATDIDAALALDLPLIGGGSATGQAGQAFARYQPQDRLANVTALATYPELNYEQVATTNPDCIIDSTPDDGMRYRRLSQIAPTFNYHDAAQQGWRDGLRTLAAAFGRSDDAEQVIEAYDGRAATLRTRLAERMANATFAVIEPNPGEVYVYDKQVHLARVLSDDLGLRPANVMANTYEQRKPVSLERLDLFADTDVFVIGVFANGTGVERDRSYLDTLFASPLWQNVPAVQNGIILEYDSELLYSSPGTASAFLDVVEEAMLA